MYICILFMYTRGGGIQNWVETIWINGFWHLLLTLIFSVLTGRLSEDPREPRSVFTSRLSVEPRALRKNTSCCCCLPCNHCSNRTWVVEEILAFGTRLRSTHCREFNYLKLCRPAYFIRTTQLLPHPGHE